MLKLLSVEFHLLHRLKERRHNVIPTCHCYPCYHNYYSHALPSFLAWRMQLSYWWDLRDCLHGAHALSPSLLKGQHVQNLFLLSQSSSSLGNVLLSQTSENSSPHRPIAEWLSNKVHRFLCSKKVFYSLDLSVTDHCENFLCPDHLPIYRYEWFPLGNSLDAPQISPKPDPST